MERLQALCPIPVTIDWHENKTTYLTIRKERGRLHLRLHRFFLKAPTPVLEALIRMSLQRRDWEARAIVRKMAHLYFSQNQIAAAPLPTQGSTYDLLAIYQSHNDRFFGSRLHLSIGWSHSSPRGRFRFITFGSYDLQREQIRINPLLDHPEVPLYFLEFIVYHEMLHAVCPARFDAAGRCRIHTAEFRAKEREFPEFKAAKEWEKTSLQFFRKRSFHGRS